MRVGAIIAAAGLSTRMKQFKQLMRLGDMSLAERVICSFRQAGIQDVVMVTGHQAAELEHQLRGLGIVFLQNEAYATTQMFDSVKIGLRYMQDKYDKILFCPVDIPLFRADTIRLELTRAESIVLPICHNRLGHPVMFDASLIPPILAYNGPGGLKGALDSLGGQTICYLPVDDEGSIMDADNREDMQYLIDMQNERLLRTEVKVAIAGTRAFLNWDARLLLRQVEATGSVRGACRKTKISYSKGWRIIHDLEDELGYVIVKRRAGGLNGGTSVVTERGLRLVELYEMLEKRVRLTAAEEFSSIFSASDLFPKSSRESRLNGLAGRGREG